MGQDLTSDDWRSQAETFFKKNLAKDLVNSDLNQLKSLAQSLRLTVKDENASQYRKAIADFYNIELLERKEKKGQEIIIERAGEMKMNKIKEENEENIHLIGKVRILFKNDNNEVFRSLEADEIFIDLSNKEIMGLNHVIFKDESLEFTGKQFFYNFEVNRGILFSGKTKLLKSGHSGLSGAYFIGEKIVRTGKEEATLYNGKLTTCDKEDPHYYFKVARIWINEEGEWGLLNGFLYIGQNPFFYIPIYYHPKKLVINPATGYKSREGWFFNSTYYIFGDIPESTNRDATSDARIFYGIEKNRAVPRNEDEVLRINKADVEKKLNQFYDKHSFYQKYPQFRFIPSFNSIDIAWRVFADAYVNLGIFHGTYFYLKVDDLEYPLRLSLLADFAFSRLVWKDNETQLYVPYNPGHKQGSILDLDNTYYYLSANSLFFRNSQWINLKGSLLKQKLNLDYEMQVLYASDTSYFYDFYRRNVEFTYIDLLTDLIQYSMDASKNNVSVFQTKKTDDNLKDSYKPTELQSFVLINIMPDSGKIPNLFGLNLINKLSFNIKSLVNLKKTDIDSKFHNSTAIGTTHPRSERYILEYFTAPRTVYNMGGVLLDYDILLAMPETIRSQNLNQSQKGFDKQKKMKELYYYIENIKKNDQTGDQTKLDYKLLLPFLSSQVGLDKNITDEKLKSYHAQLAIDDQTEHEKKEPEKKVFSDQYERLSLPIEKGNIKKSNEIRFFNFNLNYNIQDTYQNKFRFDTDATSDANPRRQFDTIELLMQNKLDVNNIIQEFNINNILDFKIYANVNLMMFKEDALFHIEPSLNISDKRDWDDLNVYYDYLLRKKNNSTEINKDWKAKRSENWKNTELSIYYVDTLKNDLSFGKHLLSGTGFKTPFKFRVFKHNRLVKENFILLNSLNHAYLVDPDYYDNRESYEKLEMLYTEFKLKLNLLPQDFNHQFSFDVGPKINWIIPEKDLTSLKDELWADESDDITWNSEIKNEARRYIYYRNSPGQSNLYSKINEFYSPHNFWGTGNEFDSPKNYRKIFENLTLNLNYSFTKNNKKFVEFLYTIKLILSNVGYYSLGNGSREIIFYAYPDHFIKLSLFNSAISYTMDMKYTTVLDEKNPRFKKLTVKDKRLDKYKIMKFTQLHTLELKLLNDLFPVKLPKGDWLSFKSQTKFIFDKNVIWDDYLTDPVSHQSVLENFYLDSQKFEVKLLMDILTLSLNFKQFNFEYLGYGFDLESGRLQLGYNVTEIPVFLRFFKINFYPLIVFDFVLKHNNYYASNYPNYRNNLPVQYDGRFFTQNKLTFSLTFELIIGEGRDFETKFLFNIKSVNEKMYRFYHELGFLNFMDDLFKSFNFANIEDRRRSSFNIEKVLFRVEHGLHDWQLIFEYVGKPEKPATSDKRNNYYWEHVFTFMINWKIDSKNQLMKLFNKTRVDEKYEKGKWRQPIISLEENETKPDE